MTLFCCSFVFAPSFYNILQYIIIIYPDNKFAVSPDHRLLNDLLLLYYKTLNMAIITFIVCSWKKSVKNKIFENIFSLTNYSFITNISSINNTDTLNRLHFLFQYNKMS